MIIGAQMLKVFLVDFYNFVGSKKFFPLRKPQFIHQGLFIYLPRIASSVATYCTVINEGPAIEVLIIFKAPI